jgi:UDP-N-acetyl-alpha-D-muramoyl-L-alanyl-L-glutamate epimerase
MSNLPENNFTNLRKKYPLFVFEKFDYNFNNDRLNIIFHFNINNIYHFYPQISFLSGNYCPTENLSVKLLDNIIFNIGMVELVSYWKTTCSPNILIKPFRLSEKQEKFWKKLYINGLGEFFHTNEIEYDEQNLFHFSYADDAEPTPASMKIPLEDSFIIPVGGGKDSIVSIELLKKIRNNNKALVVNHRGATKAVIDASGIKNDTVIEIQRTIHPLLISLNAQGFLNGHTPFSALLAFICSLSAILTGVKNIALSNESSANEATIPGTKVNHQYSKSVEFEEDFRSYFHEFVSPSVNYFSFLRPLNELQIAGLFSKFTDYHNVFRSCNAGSKTDIWCCNCSKCLFTYIILSPFIEENELVKIYGENLFEKESLKDYLEQLTGFAKEKPFECVGTIDEVNAALTFVISKRIGKLPYLLDYYKNTMKMDARNNNIDVILSEFYPKHFLNSKTENIIKEALKDIHFSTI